MRFNQLFLRQLKRVNQTQLKRRLIKAKNIYACIPDIKNKHIAKNTMVSPEKTTKRFLALLDFLRNQITQQTPAKIIKSKKNGETKINIIK